MVVACNVPPASVQPMHTQLADPWLADDGSPDRAYHLIMEPATDPISKSAGSDVRTIALVGLAHATSHFFQLLLPLLFPWLAKEFSLSFAQLGGAVSVFFVVSAVSQALAGFVVDRVGARPVLFGALGLFVAAAGVLASAQGFTALLVVAVLAGLGNAPFHPIDFTILNRRIAAERLGHAYAAHGITGNLGWAVASVFLTGIATASGSWRWAAGGAALWALAVLAMMVWHRADLHVNPSDRRLASAASPALEPNSIGGTPDHALAFMKLPAIWLCFGFFFWSTVTLSAIQSFAGPALQAMHGVSQAAGAMVVTGYTLFGVAGMLCGGFVAGRALRPERVISVCLLASAVVLMMVSTGWPPGLAAIALASLAGFGSGVAGPSRDLLIKRAAPPGATGRVYGLVYSGLDIGFALAAPLLGGLMDAGRPAAVFAVAAAALVASVASVNLVGRSVAARQHGLAENDAADKVAA